METNHENINNHCNNRTTAHISHKHVHSTLQTTLIQMMLFVWVTPQRCGRKVDRTLCLCIYGKECRIDRTLYSTLLNSTHFFSVVDRTPTHYFWSTGWEVISKSPSHYSMTGCLKNFHPRLKYNSKSLHGNKNERYVETPADVACVL